MIVKYKLWIQRVRNEPDVWDILCNEGIDEKGNIKYLHNELWCKVNTETGVPHILDGWHIGTEDFDLDEEDDWVLEQYHPGITEQIIEEINLIKEKD